MQQSSGLQIVELEITNRCNLNCKHCYVDKSNPKDLDSKKIYELIDQCQEMNIHRLVFTGGEPLLVSELFKFAEYAKIKKIPQIVLQTNGLLIKKNNIKKIKIFDLVQISVDIPPGEKPHFRKYYLPQLTKKIQLLKSQKINLILQATLHKSLLPLLDKLGEFAQKNNILIGFNRLIPIGKAANLDKELFSPLEFKEALTKITEIKKKYGKFIRCSDPLLFLVDKSRKRHLEVLYKRNKNKIIGGCIAGVAALYIDAKGNICPCAFLRHPIGNIFKEDLNDVWLKNEEIKKLRERKKFRGKCGKCKYVFYCGGCRACAFLKTGNLSRLDPFCWLYN